MEEVYGEEGWCLSEGGTQEKLLDPQNGEGKAQEGGKKNRKSQTSRRRPDLAGAQKGGQREGDRMEDLVVVQAPSKPIREGVRRGSFHNHISIQADIGSLRPDNGSLLPMEEGGGCVEVESCSFRSDQLR